MEPEWSTDVEETGQFRRALHESLIHSGVLMWKKQVNLGELYTSHLYTM